MTMTITKRKNDHIETCLRNDVRSGISNGFENYRLIHKALPEADFDDYSIGTEFLGKKISAPFLISSMTGGTESGEKINETLVRVAAELNIPFAIGSQRVYLTGAYQETVPYRKIGKSIPVLANVGAVQLNYGFNADDLKRAVNMIEADALILHLNPLQELIQKNGDKDFSGLLKKIEFICRNVSVPVIVKEVGWGISSDAALKLHNAGVSWIDVAGAGGTSWSRVESLIDGSSECLELAAPFTDWGIPTAECVSAIHQTDPEIRIIASGGIMNGVEAAKAILLGAEMVGMAARLLPAAAQGNVGMLCNEIAVIIKQYKIARFLSSGIEKIA